MVTEDLFNIQLKPNQGDQKSISHLHLIFMHIHGIKLGECYTIKYITTHDLSRGSMNTLYNTDVFKKYCSIYELNVGDHERNITYKKIQYLQFGQLFIEPRTIKKLLNEIEYEIESIRFILLTI